MLEIKIEELGSLVMCSVKYDGRYYDEVYRKFRSLENFRGFIEGKGLRCDEGSYIELRRIDEVMLNLNFDLLWDLDRERTYSTSICIPSEEERRRYIAALIEATREWRNVLDSIKEGENKVTINIETGEIEVAGIEELPEQQVELKYISRSLLFLNGKVFSLKEEKELSEKITNEIEFLKKELEEKYRKKLELVKENLKYWKERQEKKVARILKFPQFLTKRLVSKYKIMTCRDTFIHLYVPILYSPDRVIKEGKTYKIAEESRIKREILVEIKIDRFSNVVSVLTFKPNFERFIHYHSTGPDSDCIGDLTLPRINTEEQMEIFIQRIIEGLNVINFDSLGNSAPEGLPEISEIKLEQEVKTWTVE